MIYDYYTVPKDKPIWACAYETNDTEKGMALKKLPVKGIVTKGYNYHYFYELNKKGEIKKSGKVHSCSRKYADTYEECVELYNSLVKEQICLLENLLNSCYNDKIRI